MKNPNQKTLFVIIIFIIIGIGIVYYYNSSSVKTVPSQIITSTTGSLLDDKQNSLSKTNSQEFNGTLFYCLDNDKNYEIYAKKNNDVEKLIFTDKDEKEKIKFTPTMTYDGKIYAVMSDTNQVFGGSLYKIASDGSGTKEKVIDDFITSQAPVVSPDGTQITYVLFSNAEFDYGFSLYIANLKLENKVKIDVDPNTINNFTFNFDASQIVYQKGKEIIISDISGASKTSLYRLADDENYSGIAANLPNDNILVTLNNKIITINKNNKNSKIIYKSTDQKIANGIYVSADADQIAYIDKNTSNLNLIDLNNNMTNIGQASNIIQWQK